jgi:hypothetical protein
LATPATRGRHRARSPSIPPTTTFDVLEQALKVRHLRNAYQKVGMFGFQDTRTVSADGGPSTNRGAQIRVFGFSHEGSFDTLLRFLSANVLSLSSAERKDLEAFIMVFPSDLAPIVGQQVTLTADLLAGPDAVDQSFLPR